MFRFYRAHYTVVHAKSSLTRYRNSHASECGPMSQVLIRYCLMIAVLDYEVLIVDHILLEVVYILFRICLDVLT